jgi:hypothetical protein
LRKVSSLISGVALGVVLTQAGPAAALTFDNNFTSPTWAADPSALAAAEIAVPAAEAILSALFTNPVTVSISFVADTTTGGAWDSPYGYINESYNDVAALLTNHSLAHPENTALASSVANLPGAAPPCSTCELSNPFFVPEAEYMALTGGGGLSGDTIGIGTKTTWDPTQSDGITAGEGDLTGVMLHEITHDLGRVDYAFAGNPYLTPMNLDRYGCGTTSLTTSPNAACFSIDGGATDINQFSPTSDTGDWLTPSPTPTGDAFNAFFVYGQLLTLPAGDIAQMNALGWDPVVTAGVPEPSTWALFGLGFAALGLIRLRRPLIASV